MQNYFNRDKWLSNLDKVIKNISPSDYAHMVNKEKSSVQEYEIYNVIINAFYSAIKHHRKDLAELTFNELSEGTIKVTMMNYLLTDLDYDSLVIYSDLVDMTDFDPAEDGYHLNQYASQGKRDCIIKCIEKGMYSQPEIFFKIAAMNGHFEDAKYYAFEMKAKFTKPKWDSMLKDLGFSYSWKEIENVFKFIEEIDIGHPMAGYKTNKIIGECLSNGHEEAAEFIYSHGDKIISDKDAKMLVKESLCHEESLQWLVSKGVSFGNQLPKILYQMSHRENTENFILDILKDVDHKKVPWVRMLEGAIGSGPKYYKDKIKFITGLHEYTEKEFNKAYLKTIDYQDIKKASILENEHGVIPNTEHLRYAIVNKQYATSSKLTIMLIQKENMDIGINNNELLYTACLNVFQRGGTIDVIQTLLENSADPYGMDGKIIEMVGSGNRDDIRAVINKYINKEDQLTREVQGTITL
jgi:hypothetical protein